MSGTAHIWANKQSSGDWGLSTNWEPATGTPGLVASNGDSAFLISKGGGQSSFTVTISSGNVLQSGHARHHGHKRR